MFRCNTQSFFRRLWENFQQCCCGIEQQREREIPSFAFANPMYSEEREHDWPPPYFQLIDQELNENNMVTDIIYGDIEHVIDRNVRLPRARADSI